MKNSFKIDGKYTFMYNQPDQEGSTLTATYWFYDTLEAAEEGVAKWFAELVRIHKATPERFHRPLPTSYIITRVEATGMFDTGKGRE